MHIILAANCVLPAITYGGTERVVVSLAVALADIGHQVTVVANPESTVFDSRIKLIIRNHPNSWAETINKIQKADIVHLHMESDGDINYPYIVTQHGNSPYGQVLNINSVFVSADHAQRYGSNSFVYNGLDWKQYGPVELDNQRNHFHFLGKAAWRVKNVHGAIDITRQAKERLIVAGGYRLNIKMGFRFTPWTSIRFAGMVGGEHKMRILQNSKGLIFPVRWNEPFGLAIIESLYFGCPIFGTPYGSLPELISSEYGFLSNSSQELVEAIKHWEQFDKQILHLYAKKRFGADIMAKSYLERYERVLAAEQLNNSSPSLIKVPEKFLPYT